MTKAKQRISNAVSSAYFVALVIYAVVTLSA